MKILLLVDTHGKIPEIDEKVDLILIAGDFAKGDALRRMIFENGSPEEAKKEIINSSEDFLKEISKKSCPIVVSLGNAEEFAKEDIVSLIKKYKINYAHNGIVRIKGIKILCIDFFVEGWWAKKYRPNKEETQKRAVKDEQDLKNSLKKVSKINIILSHVPPYGILDKTEENNYLKLPQGNVGSKILREFIEDRKPKLVVCGHIHEAIGKIKLGETLIINPGEKSIIDFEK